MKLYTIWFKWSVMWMQRVSALRIGHILKLAGTVVIALICLSSSAANHYIYSGADGSNNGNSWANAWTNFASVTWTRGDTYFLAGGVYNENIIITKSLSGNSWIIVKKANPADNSGDSGWDLSFATNQAVINGTLSMDDGYMELDGITGDGTNGHGIMVSDQSGTNNVCVLGGSTGPYHVFHLEVKGLGFGSSFTGFDGIYNNNAATAQKGLHIAYCWIHGTTRNGITVGGVVGTSYSDYGMLFENNVISETGGCLDVNAHGQGMQISFDCEDGFTIIRNNIYRNIVGTGMIVWLGNAAAIHHDSRIYNNIFYLTDSSVYDTISPGVVYGHSLAAACTNISIYNNTIYGVASLSNNNALGQFIIDTVGATNNVLINNIWERCRFSATHRGFSTQSNNAYFGNIGANVPLGTLNQINGIATSFVNGRREDFRLRSGGYAVGTGANLSNFFTTDMNGNARGPIWDIGALQNQPITILTAPTQLHIQSSLPP